VVRNNGSSLLVQFSTAEITPVDRLGETKAWVSPDLEAARLAGLPAGVFGRIEINYSGVAGASQILAGAASNDVELHVTAQKERVRFLRGDCNSDGVLEGVTDALALLQYSFTGGPRPTCLAACDANGDGVTTGEIADALYVLVYHFIGGPPPPAPFPSCGLEIEPADVSCDVDPGC
jgi:hypothetical protein